MKTWTTPWGTLDLGRHPYDGDPALQAWSAADTLLARHALETQPRPDQVHVVFNDSFGALSALLIRNGRKVIQISDSSLSQRATLWNLDANGLPAADLILLDSLSLPGPTASGAPVVLLKVPRSLALLDYQLRQIRGFLPLGTDLASAAMVKDLHSSTLQVLDSLIGPTTTGLADQKARLALSSMAPRTLPPDPHPVVWSLPGMGLKLVNHAGVFSRDGLDGGTRLLLKNFPRPRPQQQRIVDLGCGNGILGLAAARRTPGSEIFCIDESFMAVWSARETFRVNQLGGRGYFLAGDGLEDFEKASVDLILCNPPFHFQNAQTLAIAHAMFAQAASVLKPDGELWVVANRHLGHHKVLAELFGSVRLAAADDKFVVLRARP